MFEQPSYIPKNSASPVILLELLRLLAQSAHAQYPIPVVSVGLGDSTGFMGYYSWLKWHAISLNYNCFISWYRTNEERKKDNYYLSLFSHHGIGSYRELIIDKTPLFHIFGSFHLIGIKISLDIKVNFGAIVFHIFSNENKS